MALRPGIYIKGSGNRSTWYRIQVHGKTTTVLEMDPEYVNKSPFCRDVGSSFSTLTTHVLNSDTYPWVLDDPFLVKRILEKYDW
jgi:hypothetical protein